MAYVPKIVDSWLTEPYKGIPGAVRYHNRNWAGIQGIVVHVQEGWNNGTKQHFRSVKASSTVLIARDGLIERLVPESKAPWTNGDVNNPDSQIRALIAKYGPDPNTWTLTIECEGFTGGLPYSENQYQSILWQIRDWRKRYGKVPVLAHRQINSVDRSYCPEGPNGKFLPRLYADLASGEEPAPAPQPVPTPEPKGKVATIRFESLLRTNPGFWDYAKGQNNIQQKDGKNYTIPAGTEAEVVDGPREAEGIAWYDLKLPNGDSGWVAMEVLKTMHIEDAAA